jgi:hypothetical protein
MRIPKGTVYLDTILYFSELVKIKIPAAKYIKAIKAPKYFAAGMIVFNFLVRQFEINW